MEIRCLSTLCCSAVLWLLAGDAMAHGGRYLGPEDVVPPPGSGGPRGSGGGPGGMPGRATGAPGAPAPANPAGPGGTGGRGRPGPGQGGRATGGRGISMGDDLTTWDYWWERNKAPYIRLKDSVWSAKTMTGHADFYLGPRREMPSADRLEPTRQHKLEIVLPALKKAIDSTDQRDINSACMVAMAKVGVEPVSFDVHSVFVERLDTPDQEIRETAALALGISGIVKPQSIDSLVALLRDDADGRALSGGREVNDRTRAFAAYGLGLLASQTPELEVKRKAFEVLRDALQADRSADRNLPVALLQAMSLLKIDSGTKPGRVLIGEALATLRDYYDRDMGTARLMIQSHVPTAIARLIVDHVDADLRNEYKSFLAGELVAKNSAKRRSNDLARASVLALGQLCSRVDSDTDADAVYVDRLLDTWHNHKDAQTRYFAILAIGQIGGDHCRTLLMNAFRKAKKALEKPWVALAMGVYSFEKYQQAKKNGTDGSIEARFGEVLLAALEDGGAPHARSAFAVALGLVRYQPAAHPMLKLLGRHRSQDSFCGYLCIGLALMNEATAVEPIRDLVATSSRRPQLLQQAAIALGKLGDKQVASDLANLISDDETVLAKLSAAATALGLIGDRRTLGPLAKTLLDDQRAPLSRAFSAAALGGVADKDALPWNTPISVNSNYRAAVETLTDGSAGILDIL